MASFFLSSFMWNKITDEIDKRAAYLKPDALYVDIMSEETQVSVYWIDNIDPHLIELKFDSEEDLLMWKLKYL